MSKSNLIKMERYFVCLFRSSTQSSPSHAISALEFFPGSSKYQFDQKNAWLKIYCKTRNNMKSSKGRSPGSSTTSVLVTTIGAPALPNNLPPWLTPWSGCPCQPYRTCITVCLDSLLKETDCFPPRNSQGAALWMDCPKDVTARMGLDQEWLLLPSTIPTSLLSSHSLCVPHTPEHAAYFWHNAIKTPVLQAAKQPSHYFRYFELKPQKYNYDLKSHGDPGQVLGGTNTNSSLQRRKRCGHICKDHSLGQML